MLAMQQQVMVHRLRAVLSLLQKGDCCSKPQHPGKSHFCRHLNLGGEEDDHETRASAGASETE